MNEPCTYNQAVTSQVEGLENLPPPDETVMYVPNHTSFLDIFALSGYLPRRFKYISKIEILRIPLIGWAMRFARHIAIRRTDRASQLATFKEAVACLQVEATFSLRKSASFASTPMRPE
jgi:1-acyl-sn-glycerol-3-phosphate acyltransferase|tara:strand:+ start:2200 stop:2556 length:357 start_codon:yes stop_codon:yes gene_type:complete